MVSLSISIICWIQISKKGKNQLTCWWNAHFTFYILTHIDERCTLLSTHWHTLMKGALYFLHTDTYWWNAHFTFYILMKWTLYFLHTDIYWWNVHSTYWHILMKWTFYFPIEEIIRNAAGLGLRYLDGKPQWDLMSNFTPSKHILVCIH